MPDDINPESLQTGYYLVRANVGDYDFTTYGAFALITVAGGNAILQICVNDDGKTYGLTSEGIHVNNDVVDEIQSYALDICTQIYNDVYTFILGSVSNIPANNCIAIIGE